MGMCACMESLLLSDVIHAYRDIVDSLFSLVRSLSLSSSLLRLFALFFLLVDDVLF